MFHKHFPQWHQKRYKVICNENNQRLVFSVSQKKWLAKACDEREKLQSCPEEDGFYWVNNNVLDEVKRWYSRYFSFILFQGFCDVFCHVGQNFQYTPSYRLVLHPPGGAKFLWKKWRSCDADILCLPPVGVAHNEWRNFCNSHPVFLTPVWKAPWITWGLQLPISIRSGMFASSCFLSSVRRRAKNYIAAKYKLGYEKN